VLGDMQSTHLLKDRIWPLGRYRSSQSRWSFRTADD
jgi:hypothetical protein